MTGHQAILEYGVLDSAPELPFDDIVALAARLCGTPTALVSLLDADRQWFKARVGFSCDQTDLDRSVCRHVVSEETTLVIPDLTADPRTASNPLVTGEPHIRFYAGAPLATRFGVVGALCVIDVDPRPDGLTPDQRDGLERLARQVVGLLEARLHADELKSALAQRDASAAAERISERRWRNLYRDMDQGFILGLALRDDAGAIKDWRYLDVNPAWSALVGIPPEAARGRTVRELIPGIEDDWVLDLASVVETRQPLRFTRQVSVLGRWYDGSAQWVDGDEFTVFFHEVTDRVEAEGRRDALLLLGDMLRDQDDVAEMTRRAAEIVGTTLGAIRAAYGEIADDMRTAVVEAGWADTGHATIEGVHSYDDYGAVQDDMANGRPLIIADVLSDPRTAGAPGGWRAMGVRSVVNVPVYERGRTVAMLIVHHGEPHDWTADELAFLRNAADRLEIAIARRRAELRQDVLNGEIAHRLKNTLAVVQAMASQSLRRVLPARQLDAFASRLQALGAAHDALTASLWQATDLRSVVLAALEPLGFADRFDIDGPKVAVGARAALSTSLLVHEMATNAAKYGALSVDDGRVTVVWRIEGEQDPRVLLDWTETGGPEVVEPIETGFGSKLLRLGMVGTGGSAVRYDRSGLQASFEARVGSMGRRRNYRDTGIWEGRDRAHRGGRAAATARHDRDRRGGGLRGA